jgi:hypothetical protein
VRQSLWLVAGERLGYLLPAQEFGASDSSIFQRLLQPIAGHFAAVGDAKRREYPLGDPSTPGLTAFNSGGDCLWHVALRGSRYRDGSIPCLHWIATGALPEVILEVRQPGPVQPICSQVHELRQIATGRMDQLPPG